MHGWCGIEAAPFVRAPMTSSRLSVLFVSVFPPSPVTFGAQRRIQGLLSNVAGSQDVDALVVVPPGYDGAATERDLRAYCRDVRLVPGRPDAGLPKRLLQVRSLLSTGSHVRRHFDTPALRAALAERLAARRYDLVHLEFPFLAHLDYRRAPAGAPPPRLLVDEHNVEYDLVRQMTGAGRGLVRHLNNTLEWQKLRREEVAAWRDADGVVFCSANDARRAAEEVPGRPFALVPNAVDTRYFAPRPGDPAPDGQTVLFFGTFNYYPNVDAVTRFLREVWPILAATHPQARLAIVGADPPAELRRAQGPRVDVLGLVDDLRPHLARAAAVIAPLHIGGGTRLKIVEGMSMARPVVSTRLGAEGIEAEDGRQILLADEPAAFAQAVGRLLDDPALGERLGGAARALVQEHYSWEGAGRRLEAFYRELVASAPAA